ncbi:MAG: zinc ribbon domain-containing protein [Lachnospiraceae bacterium]|nr:zinc ribbon domain-containing protein [Lachnospiraceae bacterium]
MTEISEEARKKIRELETDNRKLEACLEPLYMEIGRHYYEKTADYEAGMQEAAAKLDALRQQIHVNEKNILRLKGFRLCPNCECIVEEDAVFCGQCGTRAVAVPEADEDNVICERCGAKNKRDRKFCGICGQKLEEEASAVSREESAQAEQLPDTAQNPEGEPEPAEASAEPRPATVSCPQCGTQLPADAVFCGECGVKLREC